MNLPDTFHPELLAGKVAFVAYARLVGTTPAEQLIDETVSLFRTAHLGIPEVPAPAPASAGQP